MYFFFLMLLLLFFQSILNSYPESKNLVTENLQIHGILREHQFASEVVKLSINVPLLTLQVHDFLVRLLTDSEEINPYLTNVFFHHYHLGESTFIFTGIRSNSSKQTE